MDANAVARARSNVLRSLFSSAVVEDRDHGSFPLLNGRPRLHPFARTKTAMF